MGVTEEGTSMIDERKNKAKLSNKKVIRPFLLCGWDKEVRVRSMGCKGSGVLYRTGINIVRWLSAHIIHSGGRATKSLGLLLALAVLVSCASINSARSDLSSSNQQSKNSGDDKGSHLRVKNDRSDPHKGQTPCDSMSPTWEMGINDTIAHADYLKEIERQVIIEINMVRTDPSEYARKYLVPMRAYYHNTLLQFPGKVAISTVEGRRALDECIKELQADKSLLPLSPKKGLTLAARDHAKDQAKTGATGHTGSDTSTMESRLNRYGRWDISAGENIDYGNGDARRIVTSLLIDDGVSSRRHRRNLLNGTFKFVGVAFERHRVYKCMCVMDFAGAYN